MKCPHCQHEWSDHEQADSNNGAAVGADLFGAPAPEDLARGVNRTGQNAGSKGRRSKLSPTWQPSPAERRYCEQQGKDPDAMAKAFKGYYEAKGSVWLNWSLVWMKACREWKGPELLKPVPAPVETIIDRERNLWKLRLNAKHWNGFWGPPPGQPGCLVPRELIK